MTGVPPDQIPLSTRLPDPPAARRRVLVTGATGYIASRLLPVFRARYDLTLLDVRDVDRRGVKVEGATVADLLNENLDDLRPHFHRRRRDRPSGVLPPAGHRRLRRREALPRRAPERGYGGARLPPGPRGGRPPCRRRLLQPRGGLVRAQILARRLDGIGPQDAPKSDNYYGWAKIAYEALGFVYASGAFGRKLENVQVRIGAPREIDAPRTRGAPRRTSATWGPTSARGTSSSSSCARSRRSRSPTSSASRSRYFYGVSDNTRAFWSIANARRLIGYEPEDDSETRFAEGIRRLLIEPGANGRVGR